MEINGIVIAILPAKTGTSSRGEWMSQDYVIDTTNGGQYPSKMCFNIFGAEKIQQANIQIGQHIKVSYDIDAHEWNGRWYNSITAWKVEPTDGRQPMPQQQPMPTIDSLMNNPGVQAMQANGLI